MSRDLISSSPEKKTLEPEQNIAPNKSTDCRDPLQLDIMNWAYLYEAMKIRGINERQIKKNIAKYERNVVSLVQGSQLIYYDKIGMSKMTMKQRISEFNLQLKIRMSQVFQFISMLHMQQLQTILEHLIGSLMQTTEKMVDSIQNIKLSNYRLQKQLEDWKLRKKNILCYSCRKNVQQAKLRNLTSQISYTISEQRPVQLTDHQHQVTKIQSQCKNLEMELSSMSQEHFFNSQSDHLIELINQILKTKIITVQKHDNRQNTTQFLSRCLSDLNEIAKPLEMDYTPLQSGKDIQSSKRLGSTIGSRILSIKDLSDNEQYINKLKVMFSQPIRKFIHKYHRIIEQKHSLNLKFGKKIQQCDQQIQTSLIKPTEAMRNLQKQLLNITKQLTSLKASKQKAQKQLLKNIQSLQLNQTKIISVMSKSRLLENQNQEYEAENKELRAKLKKSHKEYENQKESIFAKSTEEKALLLKDIARLQQHIQQLVQENHERILKLKLQSKEVQTYASSFSMGKQYLEAHVQTDFVQFMSETIKSTKKSLQKTLRSIKLKSKATNQPDQSDFDKSLPSAGLSFGINNHHMKSKSQIPLLTEAKKSSRTSRNEGNQFAFFQNMPSNETEYKMKKISKDRSIIKKSQEGFYVFQGQLNRGGQASKSVMIKKGRKPSINSMIPQSKQNSKSHLASNKLTKEYLENQASNFKKSDFPQRTETICNLTEGFNIEQQGNIQTLVSQQNRVFISGQKVTSYNKHKKSAINTNLVRSHSHKRTFLSSGCDRTSLKDFEENQFEQNDERFQFPTKFNDISNLLTGDVSAGLNSYQNDGLRGQLFKKKGENLSRKQNLMVSKLKKIPTPQLQTLNENKKQKKKVIIKSSLQTPLGVQLQKVISVQSVSKMNKFQFKLNKYETITQLNEAGVQTNAEFLTNEQIFRDGREQNALSDELRKISLRKNQIISIIQKNFDILAKTQIFKMIEDVSSDNCLKRNEKIVPPIEEGLKGTTILKQHILKGMVESHAQNTHIKKRDIELFFNLSEAERYQKKIGIWNDLQSCIMVDNNFSKMTQEVHKYFKHLKQNKRQSYNQYILFLEHPCNFLEQILDQKCIDSQTKKVHKNNCKRENTDCPKKEQCNTRQIFRKLIRIHKLMHKNSCSHVQDFLGRIGFYEHQKCSLEKRNKKYQQAKNQGGLITSRGLYGSKMQMIS